MTVSTNIGHMAIPQPGRPAKFSIPARPADLLRRPRLLNFLHENIQRKLVLVSAAAGYGKTTLIVDFAHDTEYPVAWLHLDETDRDLSVLVADLVAALQHTFPTFPSGLLALAAQPGASAEELAFALNRAVESAVDEYFVLGLDDFHLIDDAAPIIRFFDALLVDVPEQMHLLMAGRALPTLDWIRLAARQEVAGLSEEHLRFTPAEVQDLLQLRNRVTLPDREAEDMVAGTEGWITGILLTTHFMWQGLMASLIQARQSGPPLYNYLIEEILAQQPGTLRQFLLESAVLPEMEAAVCNRVLGRSDSADMLRQAEARRLFIGVVGDEFRTYQYHHLFRDFLLARLREDDPERLQTLQTRAAEWYAANGMTEAAVTFFIQAGHLSRAAALIEEHAPSMYMAGRSATLRRWAEQLSSIALKTPRLYLNLAKGDIDTGDLSGAEAELDQAAAGFAQNPEDHVGRLELDLQRSMFLYRRGQFEPALTIAQSAAGEARALGQTAFEAAALRYSGQCQVALKRLPAAEASVRQAEALLRAIHSRYDRAANLDDLANILSLRGDTAQAARVRQESLALWRELATPGTLAMALNNVGWDLHLLGQYEAALATYREALEWAHRAGHGRAEATILIGQADLSADLGDLARAAELYRQAMPKVERFADWGLMAYLYRALARLDRWSMNFVGALEWLRRAALVAGKAQTVSALSNLDGLRGIVLVEMGRGAEGREVLNQVCADLDRSGMLVDLAQTLLWRACSEFRDGEAEAAGKTLARALAVAEQVGYDQMLLSEVWSVRDLLEAHRAHPNMGPRVAALLTRAEANRTRRLADQPTARAPEPAPATLEAHALGHSRLLKDGKEVSRAEWETQRARELFFFLVDHAPISRDRVLEQFWSNRPAARALANLHQTLYRLRRVLGDEVVILQGQECRLAPGLSLDYDVARFEAQARRALAFAPGDWRRLEALASGVELYTGEYLADLAVDWALDRRLGLNDLYVRLLSAYADELMSLTRYAEAREILTKALAVEELRDDLHQKMLVCLAGLGRRHEVVNHYRRYRETLRTALGLDPPPEMRALYARLLE